MSRNDRKTLNLGGLADAEGTWDVRMQPDGPGRYRVMLHDPRTWAVAGPFVFAFETADEAFAWLCDVADVDSGRSSADHFVRGAFVQARADARLWRGLLIGADHFMQAHDADESMDDEPATQADAQRAVPLNAAESSQETAADTGSSQTSVPEAVNAPSEWRTAPQAKAVGVLSPSAARRASEGWNRLTEFAAALVALTDDVVVIAVNNDHYHDGEAYVQLCREDDGALTLEAVSSRFLNRPLPPDVVNSLHELGWEDPRGEDLPNYTHYLEAGQTAPGDVAAFLVETLRVAYGAQPEHLFQFEPQPLVSALLRGDFGPRYLLNPEKSQAQRARMYLGIRFPNDLAT